MLRILDSKDPKDKELLKEAPSILDFLSEASKDHFEKVQSLLRLLKIPFVIDPKLVRGLDYYNKTVFEIMSDTLGAHNTIGAGGRYDGLITTLGGPALPSVGFATGLERVLQTMEKEKVVFPPPPHPELYFIPMGEKCLEICFQKTVDLRHLGWKVEIDLSGKKIQHGLQQANALHARFCVVMGDQELASKQIEIKEMATRSTYQIGWNEIETFLKTHIRRPA